MILLMMMWLTKRELEVQVALENKTIPIWEKINLKIEEAVYLENKDDIRYTIRCQRNITKDTFIDRIYNDCKYEGKGLEMNPYRQEYLDIIKSIEKR